MSAGVAPRPWTTWTARTAAEFGKVLAGYRDHLTQERGLAKPTVAGYLSVARKFFEHLTSSGRHDLSRLDATAVSQFVVRAGQTSCIGTTKQVITGLRSLLRFLHVAGQAPTLADSVPAVAGWRGSALPKALPPGHVERLLASCDRATASGRHDLAVLTLACASAKQSAWSGVTSTGDMVRCSSVAKQIATSGYRCPWMSARLSPSTSLAAAELRVTGRCSSAPTTHPGL